MPWAGQHLRLAVERQVPAVFGHQHRGDHGFGRQAGFDQMLRRRRFHDPLAGPAGEPGPVRDDHPVLRRDHVEPLRRLFADHMHRRPAARAVRVVRRDRLVDARQMGGQRAAIDPPFPRGTSATCVFSSIASVLAIACSMSSSARLS